MIADRPAPFVKPANLRIPYASDAGTHYHIAIQFDQQGAHDLAASHYRAAADTAEPGEFRDFCLSRYRVLTIGPDLALDPILN